MAESIRILASQLDRLKDVPKSNELRVTIGEFPGMMIEVVYFIDKWLESWLGAYSVVWDGSTTELLVAANHILVVPHKDEAIELRKKVDGFRERFTVDLTVEVRIGQGVVCVPISIVLIIELVEPAIMENDVKIIRTDVANTLGGLSVIPDRLS